jgi:predicted transcriptional regulator
MVSEGYSQEDIAAALQLTAPTISKAISLSLLAMHDS